MGADLEACARFELDEALRADALLPDRRSDEYFGSRWSSCTGAWAARLSSLPKYVVSSTLVQPTWSNSTVLKGDVANEVSKLKQKLAGEIVVHDSLQLVHPLMEHDLVDELRLMVYPLIVGEGKALFSSSARHAMELRKVEQLPEGRLSLVYGIGG